MTNLPRESPPTAVVEITLEAELAPETAAHDITKAVSGRHSIARKHLLRLRRRRPDATPSEVIQMLERQYVTAITTAGAVIAASVIPADVGIALIPGVGAATAGVKSASQQAAKKAGKEAAKAAVKAAAKTVALDATKKGAQGVARLLPAGDEQLQFEITAIFGLAIADIHGMDLDQHQAHALILGLTNERVSQQQIATMAKDVAVASTTGVVDVGQSIAAGRSDWSHWANTLATTLPGGAAQSLVRTIQTGQLDTVRENLSGKQQAAVEYGVGAVAGGVTRFVFGREVVTAARTAFADAPEEFPAHLALPAKPTPDTDDDDADADADADANPALAALEEAAKSTGTWIAGTASTATRVFRRVDIDGDGIPDAPQALTAVKNVGGAIAGATSTMSGSVAGLFRSKKRGLEAPETTTAVSEEAVGT